MREIKFRAWDTDHKAMKSWERILFKGECYWLYELEENPRLKWMQYTGLKDKNGVEIYEGDIVTKDHAVNAEVIFHNASFCVKVVVPYTKNKIAGYGFIGEDSSKDMTAELDSDCEVIGNIYENKELLNERA